MVFLQDQLPSCSSAEYQILDLGLARLPGDCFHAGRDGQAALAGRFPAQFYRAARIQVVPVRGKVDDPWRHRVVLGDDLDSVPSITLDSDDLEGRRGNTAAARPAPEPAKAGGSGTGKI